MRSVLIVALTSCWHSISCKQLTESQIVSFLSRVRAWTDIGMVAVIPSFTDAEEEQRYTETRHTADLAHITMHTALVA